MQPEGSLAHSQSPATCPYPEKGNWAETTKIENINNLKLRNGSKFFSRGCDEAHHRTLPWTSAIRSILSYSISLKSFFVL
jgi:hypothetical protein